MKIKRYLGRDMRQVLRSVREDQGPDAVILSNRRCDDGIEVIAAIDYDEALVRSALSTSADEIIDNDALAPLVEDTTELQHDEKSTEKKVEIVASELTRNEPLPDDSGNAQQPVLDDIQAEMASLRGLLETQLSGLLWKDSSRRSPVRAQILRNLARIGVAPDIANGIVDRLDPVESVKSLWQAPLAELAQMIPIADDDLLQNGGIAALIGPTGVGKTTTIAKIAAHFAIRKGSDDIARVCADSYRIGAKEHLMAFANIIGTNVHLSNTPEELAYLLDRLRKKRLILIDTEGMSQRDRDLSDRLEAYGHNSERVQFYLTLSAASQEAGLDETIQRFSKVPLKGCVVTKIDEAAQLGCVISALIRHGLSAAWLCDGQRIPDDLHAAANKRLWLVSQCLECMQSSDPRVDERLMAEQFSQVSAAHA